MPVVGGSGNAELGAARGSITIDTSDLARVQAVAQQAGQSVAQSLGQIDKGAKAAAAGTNELADAFTMLRQAAGLAGGIYGAMQLVRITAELAQEAAMADRVRAAFVTMATSAGQSSDAMMASMQKASRGMISDNNLALSANKAMLLGVAANSEEMAKLMDVARVRGQAIGMDPTEALDKIVTGVGRLSTRMLYQLGIVVNEKQAFEEYASSLGKVSASLSDAEKRTALANAIIADSAPIVAAAGGQAETSADKFDKFSAALDNAKKAAGEAILAAGAPAVVSGTTEVFQFATMTLNNWIGLIGKAKKAAAEGLAPLGNLISPTPESTARGNISQLEGARSSIQANQQRLQDELSSGTSSRSRAEINADLTTQAQKLQEVNQQLAQFHAALTMATANTTARNPFIGAMANDAKLPFNQNQDKQETDIVDHFQAITKIEEAAGQARLDATTQYESSRSETVRSYEEGIAREEQDFGISRVHQAADLAATIDRIGVDSARQAEHWARDLADSIAKATADSGKRVAEAQEASNKRIAEINQQYAKDRVKAERDHKDNLLDAAANLDAKAVFNEQKAFAKSSENAKEAHDDQITKEKAGLEERISKEAENLADRIKQDQAANAKRLADAKEADALRIQDAKDALAKQQAQEDQDRALRLARGAEDQAHQLAQMDKAQTLRLAQIDRHEAEQRKAADDAFQKQMEADGFKDAAWAKRQEDLLKLARSGFDEWYKHVITAFDKSEATKKYLDANFPGLITPEPKALGGPIMTTKPYLMHQGEFVLPRNVVDRMGGYAGVQQMAMAGGPRGSPGGATLHLSEGAITINAAPGMNTYDIAHAVRREVLDIFNNELQ